MVSKLIKLALSLIILFLSVINPVEAALDYTKAHLVESDFSGQDLSGSTFNKTNLRSSDFTNANLYNVSFFWC